MSTRFQNTRKKIDSFDCVNVIAIFLIIIGVLGYCEGSITYIPHLTDFYMDIKSELIGIGITVLLIDNVTEIYQRREEKRRLILQLGSPNNSIATEAARQLKIRGWLTDGSLRRANLARANLSRVNLSGVDLFEKLQEMNYLTNTHLPKVNLSGAILIAADLSKADLSGVDLSEADLRLANLEGASLVNANLRDADLRGTFLGESKLDMVILDGANLTNSKIKDEQLAQAKSLVGTTRPDGTKHE